MHVRNINYAILATLVLLVYFSDLLRLRQPVAPTCARAHVGLGLAQRGFRQPSILFGSSPPCGCEDLPLSCALLQCSPLRRLPTVSSSIGLRSPVFFFVMAVVLQLGGEQHQKCRGVTRANRPCTRNALAGQEYCRQHTHQDPTATRWLTSIRGWVSGCRTMKFVDSTL